MSWKKVGSWIKENAGAGASLVGSLLTGNTSGAIAAGVSLVSSATGSDNPEDALLSLQQNPESLLKLKEIYYKNEDSVRDHLETMTRLQLEDEQNQHEQTQQTIRAGDTALDKKIRWTRPKMARESWFATMGYCLGCFAVLAMTDKNIFDVTVAAFISAPAWAYLGLRTGDKLADAWKQKKSNSEK